MFIERAFGLLKCKFRRLQYLEMRLIEKIPLIIMACCVLHNYILLKEKIDVAIEDIEVEVEGDPHEAGPHQINQRAAHKRDMLANLLA